MENIEYINVVPNEVRVIRKLVPENNEFVERKWYKIYNALGSNSDIAKWCRETHKHPRYLGPWFRVGDYIFLEERVYFMWKLSA